MKVQNKFAKKKSKLAVTFQQNFHMKTTSYRRNKPGTILVKMEALCSKM